MNYRNYGNTDLKVSELGLGCQSLGGGLYHRDDEESIKTLHKAFEYGINFYDVSDHHSLGMSEKLLGRTFKESEAQGSYYKQSWTQVFASWLFCIKNETAY